MPSTLPSANFTGKLNTGILHVLSKLRISTLDFTLNDTHAEIDVAVGDRYLCLRKICNNFHGS